MENNFLNRLFWQMSSGQGTEFMFLQKLPTIFFNKKYETVSSTILPFFSFYVAFTILSSPSHNSLPKVWANIIQSVVLADN